mmetsp:Transcript_147565/g.269101  ORF Transcript_147565/g.269101 Transcript_147565/m.269101 type:complete len:82 (-) Transcript_147565:1436-1681(-)
MCQNATQQTSFPHQHMWSNQCGTAKIESPTTVAQQMWEQFNPKEMRGRVEDPHVSTIQKNICMQSNMQTGCIKNVLSLNCC